MPGNTLSLRFRRQRRRHRRITAVGFTPSRWAIRAVPATAGRKSMHRRVRRLCHAGRSRARNYTRRSSAPGHAFELEPGKPGSRSGTTAGYTGEPLPND